MITAATMWVTASLNFWRQRKIPFTLKRVLAHQSSLRDIFSAEQILLQGLAWLVSMQDKKYKINTHTGIGFYHFYWQRYSMDENLTPPFCKASSNRVSKGAAFSLCAFLWHSASKFSHCSMASFSFLVRRLTKKNECKSMHASHQLLCGVRIGTSGRNRFPSQNQQPELLSALWWF